MLCSNKLLAPELCLSDPTTTASPTPSSVPGLPGRSIPVLPFISAAIPDTLTATDTLTDTLTATATATVALS